MSDFSLYLPPNSIPNLPVIVKAGPKACLPNGGSPGSGPRLPWLSRIGLLEGDLPTRTICGAGRSFQNDKKN